MVERNHEVSRAGAYVSIHELDTVLGRLDSALASSTVWEVMAESVGHLNPELRASQKQASRAADARALSSGAKSRAQVKEENGSLAFSKSQARINLASARKLV